MIIHVKVIPGSKNEEIEKIDEKNYIVHLKERAEKGKANIALIKILARYFNVSDKNVVVKSKISRLKVIEIK